MTHEHNEGGPAAEPPSHGVDRRRFLRLGGLTVALAAVVAACDNTEAGHIGRVGLAPTTTKLPTVTTTDAALLRTSASLQHSLLEVYNKIKDDPKLLDPTHQALVEKLISDAEASAKAFDALTTATGASAWTCGNSKFDSVLINPAYQRITVGAPATPEAKAIVPSDDMRRDMLTLVHGMESIIGATYQQFVTLLSKPAMRAATLAVGARSVRHAALLALTINTDRPGGYVSGTDQASAQVTSDTTGDSGPTTTPQNIGETTTTAAADGAPTPTEIIPPSALPSLFGATSTFQIVVGAGDENGTRLKVNLETPSINSFEYEYLTPSC